MNNQQTESKNQALILPLLALLNQLKQDKPFNSLIFVNNGAQTEDRLLGNELQIESQNYVSQSIEDLLNLPFSQRYDMAVMQLSSEQDLNSNDVVHAITKLKDLMAKHCIVCFNPALLQNTAQYLPQNTLQSLGFSVLVQNSNLVVYQFNIYSYKQVPDWLNSRFWANPQNFNKFRW